jgi:zinc ribbon protein
VALACVRCGAQNPDGNLYCQSCGAPLTAPAGVATAPIPGPLSGPPPGIPPPVVGQAAYQSPYYAPTAVSAPVRRTPWMLIIAGVVLLTVLMAGFGTVLALSGRPSSNTSGGGIADLASPSPGVTPSPIASPTSAGPGNASNDGVSLTVPSGWTVDSKDGESIILTDSNGEGSVTVASGPSVPEQTAQNNKDTIDNTLRSKYPDTRDCPNSKPGTASFNGANGIAWTLCFTLTSGSSSVPAAASLFAGANASGGVYYVVMVLTSQNNLQSYLNQSKPILQSVHWKLS